MRKLTAIGFAIAIATLPFAASASSDSHADHHPTASSTTSTMADGEVRKVDKEAAKITLRHGEIRTLEMPAMTMVFQVKDKAMLDTVKVGDKVRFSAENAGGALTIVAIEVVK